MRQNSQIIKIVTVSILIFIVMLFFSLIINLIRYTKVTALENDLKDKINYLSGQIEENQQAIDQKSNLKYIEQYAREILRMKIKGEKVFVGT